MNRRLARKRDLIRTGRFPKPVTVPGLFDATGSIALAIGVLRPRVLIDPRAYGEHRALREYVLYHEAWHVVASHTRVLWLLRWLGIWFAFSVGVGAACWTSVPVMALTGFAFAWFEAKHGLFTVDFRAKAETDADATALSVMRREHFASAVTALFEIQTPRRGLLGWADGIVYGKTATERLARVGVFVTEDSSRDGAAAEVSPPVDRRAKSADALIGADRRKAVERRHLPPVKSPP